MGLVEDDLLFRTVLSAPLADSALDGAPDTQWQRGVTALHLLDDGDGAQGGCGLQHRADLGVEQVAQRIGPSPAPRGRGLRWQKRIRGLAVGGSPAVAGLGGSGRRGIRVAVRPM